MTEINWKYPRNCRKKQIDPYRQESGQNRENAQIYIWRNYILIESGRFKMWITRFSTGIVKGKSIETPCYSQSFPLYPQKNRKR